VNGDAAQFNATSGKAGVFTTTTGTAGYFSSSNGRALVTGDGGVGIGTNSTLYKLNVKGTLYVDGDNSPITAATYIKSNNNYTALDVSSLGSGDGAHIDVATGKALSLNNFYVGGINTGLRIAVSGGHWDQYLDGDNYLKFASNNVLRAWISPIDGSYHNSSDMRLKKDITPFTNVLPGISKLQAYTYHMKGAPDDAPLSIGFMAQEVEAQFPQMVSETEGYKSLCYDQFAVLSIQAVKEQQEHIDQLEQRVKELEEMVKGLVDKK
jgi:hypothetical protein